MNSLVLLAAGSADTFPMWVLLTVGCIFIPVGILLAWANRRKRIAVDAWVIATFIVGGLVLIGIAMLKG